MKDTSNAKESAKKKTKKLTHTEKMSFALREVEKAKQRLIKLTEKRILEIGRLAEHYGLLDLDNSLFEEVFKNMKADCKK